MTRKDYRLIAQGLSVAVRKANDSSIDVAVNELCYTLGLDNQRFNPARFKYAIYNGGSDKGFKKSQLKTYEIDD